jgi:hypothetical protein
MLQVHNDDFQDFQVALTYEFTEECHLCPHQSCHQVETIAVTILC